MHTIGNTSPFPTPELMNMVPFGRTSKHCSVCDHDLPMDSFPKDKARPDGISEKCTKCLKNVRGLARNNRYRTIQEQAAKAIMDRMASRKIDAPHVSELCEGMIGLFGGLDQFCVFWHGQIQAAAAQKPGGKVVLDACVAMKNLVQASTEHRPSAPDQATMTQADLDTEIAAIMSQILNELEVASDVLEEGRESFLDPPGVHDEP